MNLIDFISISFQNIGKIVGSGYLTFIAELASFSLNITLLTLLIIQTRKQNNIKKKFVILIALVLINLIVENISWLLSLFRLLFVPSFPIQIAGSINSLTWGFCVFYYKSLALFLENLVEQKFIIRFHHKLFLVTDCALATFFVCLAIYSLFSPPSLLPLLKYKVIAIKITLFYLLIVMLPSILIIISKIRNSRTQIPLILKKQLYILIYFLIIPYIILDIIPILMEPRLSSAILALKNFSIIFLTSALYLSVCKMVRLRFLNFQDHIQSTEKFMFVDTFKNFLEKLGRIVNTTELTNITRLFFKETFEIPIHRTSLHTRTLTPDNFQESPISKTELNTVETSVENFITENIHNPDINAYLRNTKILIMDEVAFNNFYEETTITKQLLTFLEKINADIFIPIYNNNIICAYVVVERHSRPDEFYTNVERDEMLLFTSYVSNVIYLLQNRNLIHLIEQQKELKEELFTKHQEINQYKESIRSFLRNSQTRKIGILFYKNRQFIFGNKFASELITININTNEGHSLTKTLTRLARDVEMYHATQTTLGKNEQNEDIVIVGAPNLDKNNVIILVYYPEISDIIKKELDFLKDPSDWDYLLYLETTKSGQLINKLIPSNSETFLNFKINLLKIALSKKALLLEMPDEDIMPTVEIIHNISLRETLSTIDLKSYVTTPEVAIKILGINPIFSMHYAQPLLEKLNGNGTLFIKNIHFLDIETQNYLAEFIKYGFYHIFKSDQTVLSDVRIIVSTNQQLAKLVVEGKFSKALFNELKKTTLNMPSLLTVPQQELMQLLEEFSKQAIGNNSAFGNLIGFSKREREKLISRGAISLNEFKILVQKTLVHKSKMDNIDQEIQFNPSYHLVDQDLVDAARLGKRALKDPKIMTILWNKFKSQNKIAALLGVNRSSVNRRCKEYKLIDIQ